MRFGLRLRYGVSLLQWRARVGVGVCLWVLWVWRQTRRAVGGAQGAATCVWGFSAELTQQGRLEGLVRRAGGRAERGEARDGDVERDLLQDAVEMDLRCASRYGCIL